MRTLLKASTSLEHFNPIVATQSIWRQRGLIIQLAQRDVGQRYRGSFLGVLWSVVNPLALLAIYTVLFGVIFRSRWQSDVDTPPLMFALILFAGLSAFNLFSEVVNRAPTLVLNVPNYVKRVVFPLEILPLVALCAALVTSLVSVALVLIGSALLLGTVSPTVLFLPLVYVPLCLLSLAFGWLFASLGVYIRDVSQGTSLLVQVLFFLSPIFYPLSSAPEFLQPVLQLNPLSFILEMFRAILVWGGLPDFSGLLVWTLVTGAMALVAYVWFMLTKKGFADVI
jgi:lipopolysaccharide transport system permease protein